LDKNVEIAGLPFCDNTLRSTIDDLTSLVTTRRTRDQHSQRGQAVVEFTLVALLFFTVVFSIVEFSHLFYVKSTLRHALGDAGRFMVTGRTVAGPLGTNLPREDAIKKAFEQWLIGTGAGLQSFQMTCSVNPCTGGNPDEVVTLTATFNKPLFIAYFSNLLGGPGCPVGNVCFTMRTTWKNEPFH
jgi:hypothetical protein